MIDRLHVLCNGTVRSRLTGEETRPVAQIRLRYEETSGTEQVGTAEQTRLNEEKRNLLNYS